MSFFITAFIAPGGGELILIMLALLLLFGPKDAPRILRNIQNVLNKLQRSAADFRYKLMYEDLNRPPPEEPPAADVQDTVDEELSDPDQPEPAEPHTGENPAP